MTVVMSHATCAWCDEPIEEAYAEDYCSRSCERKQYWAEKRGGSPTCQNCGERIEADDGVKNRKYCSRECYFGTHRETRECVICDEEFEVKKSSENRACGRECGNALISKSKRGERIHKECIACGDGFEVVPSQDHRRFCSRECSYDHRSKERVERRCERCDETFEVLKDGHNATQRFCSDDCRIASLAQYAYGGHGRHRATCGHMVRSAGEKTVCEWLFNNGVRHAYETEGPAGTCDWCLPDHDTYVEFWGMEGDDNYETRKHDKRTAYDDANVRLIDVHPHNLDDLDNTLTNLKETNI